MQHLLHSMLVLVIRSVEEVIVRVCRGLEPLITSTPLLLQSGLSDSCCVIKDAPRKKVATLHYENNPCSHAAWSALITG